MQAVPVMQTKGKPNSGTLVYPRQSPGTPPFLSPDGRIPAESDQIKKAETARRQAQAEATRKADLLRQTLRIPGFLRGSQSSGSEIARTQPQARGLAEFLPSSPEFQQLTPTSARSRDAEEKEIPIDRHFREQERIRHNEEADDKYIRALREAEEDDNTEYEDTPIPPPPPRRLPVSDSIEDLVQRVEEPDRAAYREWLNSIPSYPIGWRTIISVQS